MVNVQLKIVEEGLKHPLAELTKELTYHLFDDDILVRNKADLTLKIKFTRDVDQDLILIQLRETDSKAKLGEKIIHYIDNSWIKDIVAESHALLATIAVDQDH
jgi:hypothetical protein